MHSALIFLSPVNQEGCRRYASCWSRFAAQILSVAPKRLYLGPFLCSKSAHRLAVSFHFFVIDLGGGNASSLPCACFANDPGVYSLKHLVHTSPACVKSVKSHCRCPVVANNHLSMGGQIATSESGHVWPNVAWLAQACSIIAFAVRGWHGGECVSFYGSTIAV